MKPYKHKLGELGPEHFDGDPIHRELNESQKMQRDAIVSEVLGSMPKNAIQKPVTGRQQEKKSK